MFEKSRSAAAVSTVRILSLYDCAQCEATGRTDQGRCAVCNGEGSVLAVECPRCSGSGLEKGASEAYFEPCGICSGGGWAMIARK